MSITPLVTVAAESSASDINPWVIGAIILGLLTSLLLVVVTIGGGREHS